MSGVGFSAPGKVLLVGGYLVLDRAYCGYVLSLSARMYCKLEASDQEEIRVRSPQFLDAEWTFKVTEIGLESVSGPNNVFISTALKVAAAYLGSWSKLTGVDITIYSDRGFQSQDRSGTEQFPYYGKKISDVPKTGLGSSAALTSSLMTCLMSYYGKMDILGNSDDYEIVHKLSQLSHCLAQGKIGSGFDVASAVFGSIKYRRFEPEHLQDALNMAAGSFQDFSESVQRLAKSSWRLDKNSCGVPKGLRLMLGDVKGGSETPKMVSKVLEWRKSDPNSTELWEKLDKSNMVVLEALGALNDMSVADESRYLADLLACTGSLDANNAVGEQLRVLRHEFLRIRELLRQMGSLSGVPIEPVEQTQLLDRLNKVPGIIGGVVPGAGGNDAVVVIVLDELVNEIKESTKDIGELEWLDVYEESHGLVQFQPGDLAVDV
ncbi:hypothetical protein CANCADRAFT_138593 [Tortispora caseinolytica NRRL Y-17796]|uniref:Phosphomevalonate kinase n=1 Tax=Tortispora caseinolytica NRRL Y-17796 TaxID=767744 RepID=A0A1E4TCA5_9ASCO|nr:hypothetical protein CANCADRAFT_138593 [Tortispora caseinolytica NRRL Y-17796]